MKKTKIISFVLAVSMLFSLTPLNIFAFDSNGVQSVNTQLRENVYDNVIANDSSVLLAEVTSPGAIETSNFIFDDLTGTITGYKNKDVPVNLIIPAEINGNIVKHVGPDAFKYSSYSSKLNKPLESIDLPEGLESIEKMAFQGNVFTDVTIPSTVKEINGGFRMCKNLVTVSFKPNSQLKKLGEDSFYGTSLASITLPEGLEEIGATAFADSKLTYIKIPDSVIKIGKSAFQLNLFEEFTVPSKIIQLNGGIESGGLFYNNYDNPLKNKTDLRLTKVYDTTGIATALNTRGIVNPVSVKIKYVNEDTGEEIKTSETIVGREFKKIVMVPGDYSLKADLADGDGKYITDYKTPSDRYELYTKFFTEIAENYFTKNQEITFAAPQIPGFTAPDPIKKTLSENVNEVLFLYKPAGNAKLTLEGEGLTSSVAAGDVGIGADVILTILSPDKKEISSFKINGVDKTAELKSTGITSSYTFKIIENTDVKVEYKEAVYNDEFKIKSDKTEIKIGQKTNVKAFYRDIAVKLPNEDVVWTVDYEDIASFDKNTGEVTTLKSGTVILKAALKSNPKINDSITLVISPVKVRVRLESDYMTLLEPTEVEVTDLDLSKYNITAKFDVPKAIHAIVKALDEHKETTGIDPADKKQFDSGSGGSYIRKIGNYGVSGNKGWMFYVDDKYVNVGVADRIISDGEYINVWRIDNYMDNTYVYFDKEVYSTEPGKDLTIQLKGNGVDMWTGKPKDANVEGITIMNDTDPMADHNGNFYTTDKDGNVTIEFASSGRYHISAMKSNDMGELVISRPYAVVNVTETVKSSDTSLASLKYGEKEIALVEGQTSYEVKLPKETTEAPIVSAILKDHKASIEITQASSIPGQAKIEVTAEDGKTIKEYYVKFILEQENSHVEILPKAHLEKSLEYILRKTKNPAFGSEWNVFCLARGSYKAPDDYYESYYNDVAEEIKSKKGILSSSYYSEYSKLILALTAIRKDVTDVGGYNQLEKLADYESVTKQGINGSVFALIAFDSYDYKIPDVIGLKTHSTRDKLIQNIIGYEKNKGKENAGGWSYGGDAPDPDITAMALQAIAPYYNDKPEVKAAVDRGIEWLSKNQKENGGYESWGSYNPESVSQVIVALTRLGINPDTDKRFIKGDNSLIDALMEYALPEGGFKHGADDKEPNGMATEQGTYALVAYDRFINGKSNLYDMTDVNIIANPAEPKEEKIELPDGEQPIVNIPENGKDCKVHIKAEDINKKIKIIISSEKTSKVIIDLTSDAEIPYIEANKGDVSAVIPNGVKVIGGNASSIEMITSGDEKDEDVIRNIKSSIAAGKKLDKIDKIFSMGGSETVLFSDYITLTFKNLKGRDAAYLQGDKLHTIHKYSNDVEGKNSGKQEYAYDSGNDLIVKTKHFTDFIAYSLSVAENPGGDGKPTNKGYITLSIDKKTIGKGYVLKPVTVEFTYGETAWDVLKRETEKRNIEIKYIYSKQYNSIYVQSIDGDGEFDHGQESGWMYNVNGKYQNYGASKYVLKDNDEVQWRYTTKLGSDIDADTKEWNDSKKTDAVNNKVETATGEVSAENSVSAVFTDSDSISTWAVEYINKASQKGFVAGVNGKFNPKENITRSQFIKIITGILGINITCDKAISYNDVAENDWFYPYINAAYNMKIVEGVGAEFRPNDNITREQMAVMIVRGLDLKHTKPDTVIKDLDKVSTWAKEEVETAVALGLMTGYDGYFNPDSFATREMATVVAMRSYDYMSNSKIKSDSTDK